MPLVSYNPAAGLDNTVKTVTLRRSRGGFTFRGGVAKDFTKCDILIDTEKQEIGIQHLFVHAAVSTACRHRRQAFFLTDVKDGNIGRLKQIQD